MKRIKAVALPSKQDFCPSSIAKRDNRGPSSNGRRKARCPANGIRRRGIPTAAAVRLQGIQEKIDRLHARDSCRGEEGGIEHRSVADPPIVRGRGGNRTAHRQWRKLAGRFLRSETESGVFSNSLTRLLVLANDPKRSDMDFTPARPETRAVEAAALDVS